MTSRITSLVIDYIEKIVEILDFRDFFTEGEFFMKKILCVFLVIFMSFSLFSQDLGRFLFDVIESSIEERREIEANKSVLLQTLEKNREKNVEIKVFSFDWYPFLYKNFRQFINTKSL